MDNTTTAATASGEKKQHRHLSKTEGGKHTPDVSFLSQMSVDAEFPHRRPKSSQSFLPRSGQGKSKRRRPSPGKDDLLRRERSPQRASPDSCKKQNERKEGEWSRLGSFKAAWSVYQTRTDVEPRKEQHMRKNALRDQIRPAVRVPPSKAFPKELALINKLLTAERQKAQLPQKQQQERKAALFKANRGKALSKSVCIDDVRSR